MSCAKGCFQAQVQACTSITIRAGFPPNYSLYWCVQKIGKPKIYQKLTSTENNGDLVISADEFPDGYLFPGCQLRIQIRQGNNFLQPILMVFDDVEYECIMAELIDLVTTDDLQNVITGQTAELPDGPGSPYLIPITNEDFLTADEPPVPHATIYLNSSLDGKALAIFWNDVPRYLTPTEWQHVPGGIEILVPGFDATANAYSLFIYIIGNEIIPA